MFILFKIHRLATSALCLTLLFTSQTAFAQKTIWEIGAGISGLTAPHYPGTTSKKNYLIPYPYLTLETDVITIDKGIQAYLFKTEDVRFDVTLDFGLPVNSDESRLRTGMPKLNTVIQFGPSLEITLQGGKKKPSELRLEFPVRTAIATDIKHSENIGWIFEPGISYEKIALALTAGPTQSLPVYVMQHRNIMLIIMTLPLNM